MKKKLKLTDQYLSSLPVEMTDGIEQELKEADIEPFVMRKGFAGLDIEEGEERVSIARMSTRTIDSDNEIVVPFALDVTRFQKNPVLMFNHDWSGTPIGSVSEIKMNNFSLDGKLNFADTMKALEIWSLVRDGHLRSNSIGFIITQYVSSSDKRFSKLVDRAIKEWDEFTVEQADRLRGFVTRGILLENSVVGIPANEDALMQAVSTRSLDLSNEMINLLNLDVERVELEDEDGPKDVPDGEQVEVDEAQSNAEETVDPDETTEAPAVPEESPEEQDTYDSVEEGTSTPPGGKSEPKLVARLVKQADPKMVRKAVDARLVKRLAKDEIDLRMGKV